jgi:hypothetical protein
MDSEGPAMTEPTVEEIVARIEEDIFTVTQDDIRAIIASWRERGAQLEGANLVIEKLSNAYEIARAALKDKP